MAVGLSVPSVWIKFVLCILDESGLIVSEAFESALCEDRRVQAEAEVSFFQSALSLGVVVFVAVAAHLVASFDGARLAEGVLWEDLLKTVAEPLE